MAYVQRRCRGGVQRQILYARCGHETGAGDRAGRQGLHRLSRGSGLRGGRADHPHMAYGGRAAGGRLASGPSDVIPETQCLREIRRLRYRLPVRGGLRVHGTFPEGREEPAGLCAGAAGLHVLRRDEQCRVAQLLGVRPGKLYGTQKTRSQTSAADHIQADGAGAQTILTVSGTVQERLLCAYLVTAT